jgi:dimethylaniline monooxygenase (N-oxide forming)
MPRTIKGKPSDHAITHRQRVLNHFFDSMYPSFSENTMNLLCSAISYFMYSSLPSKWGFDDPPSMFQHPPVVSENLVSDMHNGSVEPVPGIKRIVGGRSIELTDGSVIDVDAIVFATGYRPNFSLIEVDGDEYDFRQLYRSIFPLKYSKSLAFAGFGITLFPALAMYDLSAMYISQVFAGLTSLPSRDIMQSVVMKQEKWRLDRLAQRGGSSGVTEGIFPLGPWLADLATTLGLGLDENLGYGVEGWKFWWQDRKFCDVLMGGLDSPHIYRVFDGEGKRKIWEGARAEICKVNGVAPL